MVDANSGVFPAAQARAPQVKLERERFEELPIPAPERKEAAGLRGVRLAARNGRLDALRHGRAARGVQSDVDAVSRDGNSYSRRSDAPTEDQPEIPLQRIQSIAYVIQRLERKGWVRRVPGKLATSRTPESERTARRAIERGKKIEGRRVILIKPTREGKEWIEDVFTGRAKVVQSYMRALGGRELFTLKRLCDKLRKGDLLRFYKEITRVDFKGEELRDRGLGFKRHRKRACLGPIFHWLLRFLAGSELQLRHHPPKRCGASAPEENIPGHRPNSDTIGKAKG